MAAVPAWSTAVAEESAQQRLSPKLPEREAEETIAHLPDRTRYLQRKVDWLEKVHDRIVGIFRGGIKRDHCRPRVLKAL